MRRFFWEWEFEVFEGVFPPQPETEVLVEKAVEIVAGEFFKTRRKVVFVDVGTGTGCIAISVSKELDGLGVDYFAVATDRFPLPLRNAVFNARRLGARVSFVMCDLLSALKRADVVLSNPPYVSAKVKDVVPFPEYAVVGGVEGFELTLRLIRQAHGLGAKYVVIESGWDDLPHFGLDREKYRNAIESEAKSLGFTFKVIKDYYGKERFALLERNDVCKRE